MKPETKFKIKVLDRLKKIPNLFFDKIQQVSKHGTLDIYICFEGRFIALELKKSELEELDPMQLYSKSRIEQAGGLAFKLTPENMDDVFEKVFYGR